MQMNKVALIASAGFGMAFLAACADSTTAPDSRSAALAKPTFVAAGTSVNSTAVAGEFRVCKSIESNTAGVFTISRTPAGGGFGAGSSIITSKTIQPGECFVVVEDQAGSGSGSDVTVTETSAGLQSISGVRISTTNGQTNIVAPANPHTDFINSIHGVRLTFTNVVAAGCTYTQGYWKTHGPIPKGKNSNEWNVANITLGTKSYTALEALSIFNTPVGGNGLISLAHQLLAAKLNVANGASSATIAATITAADALIGSLVVPPVGSGYLDPATTSTLTGLLGAFNEGITGPGHCGDEVVN
jgi:hypothetical protein